MLNPGAFWDFFLAFTVVLVVMPVLIHFAPKMGLLDHPDERKQHEGKVPLVGGVAVYIGLLVVLGVRHFELAGVREMLAAGMLLVATGVVDDRRHMSYRVRFLVQVVASALMVFGAGVLLVDFGHLLAGFTFPLAWAAIPMTVFCVVGVTNASNMIDGVDGLSAGIMLVTLLGLSAAVWLGGGRLADSPEIPVLMGTIVAYLLFNFRLPWRSRALAFFGDAGTLVLGLMLAWLLVRHSQGANRDIAPVTALWLFAVPLFDTVFVMIKRYQAGVSMVEGDREHLHHAFLRSGWSVNGTVVAIVMVAVGFAALGLLLEKVQVPEYIRFYGFVGVSMGYYFTMNRAWKSGRFLGKEIF